MGNAVVFVLCLFTAFLPFELLGGLEGLPSVARLIGVCVLTVAVLAVFAGHRLRRLHYVLIMQTVFVAWSALTMLWSLAPEFSVGTTERIVLSLIFAALVWEFATTPGKQSWILRSFLIGLLVPALLTFATFAGLYHMDVSEETARFTGAGNDQNYLAMILALGIVVAAYFATAPSGYDRWLRPCYWSFAALAAVAARLTGSRSGLVCIVIAGVFAALFGSVSRRKIIYCLLLLVFIGLLVIVMRIIVPQSLQERSTEFSTETGTYALRLAYWERGLTYSLVRNPVAGVGVGSFSPVTTQLSGVKTGVAHNMIVSALVEEGIIGLVLYLLLLYSVYRVVRGMPRREKLLWLGLTSIWLWQSMATTLLTDKLFWLLPALAACQAVSLARSHTDRRGPAPSGSRLPAAGRGFFPRWRRA